MSRAPLPTDDSTFMIVPRARLLRAALAALAALPFGRVLAMTATGTPGAATPAQAPAETPGGMSAPAAAPLDPENTIYLDLASGRVVLRLRPDLAPRHVERIKTLSRQGFYDGAPFHRVIEGFMAQTGDPVNRDGTGGSSLPDLPAEFNAGRHVRGAASMARAQNPNSANSQFFIVFQDKPHLDGQYTYWGEVVSGMEFVDAIKRGDPRANGSVRDPDVIVRMRVAADVTE